MLQKWRRNGGDLSDKGCSLKFYFDAPLYLSSQLFPKSWRERKRKGRGGRRRGERKENTFRKGRRERKLIVPVT